MMRLDKLLAHSKIGTRKEVKKLIRAGYVSVNGLVVKDDDYKVDEAMDEIVINGEVIHYVQFHYLMLNKPRGYVCANEDGYDPLVFDLIDEAYAYDLFSVGRLDKDTEGLLILTDDGKFAHELTSPKHHIDKEYYVELKHPIKNEAIQKLEEGVTLDQGEVCQGAKIQCLDSKRVLLTIQEGKYHQVKRMMQAIDNQVTYLKRTRIGALSLDETLEEGTYRALMNEEVARLKGNKR